MAKRKKQKHVSQKEMWEAAKIYRSEGDKAFKAKAYFCAFVARGCELEALLRIFDFVETESPKDRCYNLNGLINRAFAKRWIPNDALRWWKEHQGGPLKPWLHFIRESRNGVHAHLFQKDLFTRATVSDVSYVVRQMYTSIENRNARNLMRHLYETGEVTAAEYRDWQRKDRTKRLDKRG